MNIGSISSSYAPQTPQRAAEATEINKGGRDNDGDSDDSGIQAVQSAPRSTVNANGQIVGQVVNITA